MPRIVFPRRGARLSQVAARFHSDREGAVAVIFCVALIPLAIAVAAAIDYAKYSRARVKLVESTDAGALAGVVALQQGKSVAEAKRISQDTLMASAGPLGQYVTINSVTPFLDNQQATVTIKATITMPTSFSGILNQNTTSQSKETIASGYLYGAAFAGGLGSQGKGSFSGTISSDPEIAYADGSHGFVDCPAPNWYNALSDAGIQINFSCTKNGSYNYIRRLSLLLGDHVVRYDVYNGPIGDIAFPRDGSFGRGLPATITVDGQDYVPPQRYNAYPGPDNLVVDDPKGRIYVTPYIDTKASWSTTHMYSYMRVRVVTPVYDIDLAYDWGWYNQEGGIYIKATNPGLCGTPGGVWGRSVAGQHVGQSNYYAANAESAYQVIGPVAKSPEFYWTTGCSNQDAAIAAKAPRLVQ